MLTTSDNGDEPVRLAVIGAGTWGSVLAHIAAPCAQVSLYSATGKMFRRCSRIGVIRSCPDSFSIRGLR